MRKLLLAFACMLFMTGLVLAAEYSLVSYDKDKKELTVKDKDDKEATLKLSDKTKYIVVDKDGNKTDGKLEDFEQRWMGDKAKGRKLNLTVDGPNITEVTVTKKK
jgi:hypothetical protein